MRRRTVALSAAVLAVVAALVFVSARIDVGRTHPRVDAAARVTVARFGTSIGATLTRQFEDLNRAPLQWGYGTAAFLSLDWTAADADGRCQTQLAVHTPSDW